MSGEYENDIIDLVDLSQDAAIEPLIQRDEDGFVRNGKGDILRIQKDSNGKACAPRFIHEGNIICLNPVTTEDLASEGRFLAIVLGTRLLEGSRIPILWCYTTAYLKAMRDNSTLNVKNKEQIAKSIKQLGLYANGLYLSDACEDVPIDSIEAVLSEDELQGKFTLDRRIVVSHLPGEKFALVRAYERGGTPEI